ncbi:hypothetical protein FSP39_001509 [Pinctada imbricata]|uniref:SSD domain-containing protein n=1 Tax=Pinctada imbricata TaxID=66713 RepID=A0AA89C4P2_PINIB|nr:hypothetical protein FSP39_001509 [Pinctada imbricata]
MDRLQEMIGNAFSKYGQFVARRPMLFLLAPMVLCLFGLGLLRLETTDNVEEVYTPMNSQASKDRATIANIFGDKTGSNFYTQNLVYSGLYGDIIFKTKNSQTILDDVIIDEILRISQMVMAFQISSDNGTLTYSDVCAQNSGHCVVEGDIFFTSDFRNRIRTSNVTYPYIDNVSIRSTFGNIEVLNGKLNFSNFVRLRFYLRQDTDYFRSLSRKWEDKFIDAMAGLTSNVTDIAYANSRSLDNELNANIGGDIVFFSITFTLMIVYATMVTTSFTCNCLTDRQHLGRAGVMAAGFAILTSMGFVSLCGVQFVDIVGFMPFLIIVGIGVDDMFLLLAGLSETYETATKDGKQWTVESRVMYTMRKSGIGITITSVTDVIAFLAGISSSFLGVRNFCIYTGEYNYAANSKRSAVFFCYIFQITFFLACIVLHLKRMENNKHCCICFYPISQIDKKKSNPLERFFCDGQSPDEDIFKRKLLSNLHLLNSYIAFMPFRVVKHDDLDEAIGRKINRIAKGDDDLKKRIVHMCKYTAPNDIDQIIVNVENAVLRDQQKESYETMKKDNVGNLEKMLTIDSKDSKERRRRIEGPLEWGPPALFNWFLSKSVYKVFVGILILVYIPIAIWGCTKYREGLILSNLVSEDSYYYRYSTWDDSFFANSAPISFVISGTRGYSNSESKQFLDEIVESAQNDQSIDGTLQLNWYHDFIQSPFYTPNQTEANFISSLRNNFLPAHPFFENDIKFDASFTSIASSRIYVFSVDIKDSTEQGKLMKRMRNIAHKYSNVIAYSPGFIFYEQYVAILPNTLQTVGIAVGAIFLVTFFFMPSVRVIFLVSMSMVLLMVGLFGFMFLWDLSLSSVTMIHIIMSVGFSVDFSAHICHGFSSSKQSTNEHKVKEAVRKAGGPIFNGAISSLIGIIMLIFSKSYIFQSFFKVMLLIIVLGIAHSLFFLPVILTISCRQPPATE